jgi:hypothetical protein
MCCVLYVLRVLCVLCAVPPHLKVHKHPGDSGTHFEGTEVEVVRAGLQQGHATTTTTTTTAAAAAATTVAPRILSHTWLRKGAWLGPHIHDHGSSKEQEKHDEGNTAQSQQILSCRCLHVLQKANQEKPDKKGRQCGSNVNVPKSAL